MSLEIESAVVGLEFDRTWPIARHCFGLLGTHLVSSRPERNIPSSFSPGRRDGDNDSMEIRTVTVHRDVAANFRRDTRIHIYIYTRSLRESRTANSVVTN